MQLHTSNLFHLSSGQCCSGTFFLSNLKHQLESIGHVCGNEGRQPFTVQINIFAETGMEIGSEGHMKS